MVQLRKQHGNAGRIVGIYFEESKFGAHQIGDSFVDYIVFAWFSL